MSFIEYAASNLVPGLQFESFPKDSAVACTTRQLITLQVLILARFNSRLASHRPKALEHGTWRFPLADCTDAYRQPPIRPWAFRIESKKRGLQRLTRHDR